MSYPIKYPTPQGANIQIFNFGETNGTQTWVKPQGASFVWFTLIGGGGAGDALNGGGGSSAVTNCMVPAFLIPDSLIIKVGAGGITGGVGQPSLVNYKTGPTTSSYNLLTANAGIGATSGSGGGAASTSNYFSCMGFFQSVAGQNGANTVVTASPTTFLGGGGYGAPTGNYGYSFNNNNSGFFQTQPIIVGMGGSASSADKPGGIGCGGSLGNANGGAGGNGLVVIITW
jgi:hypothetical protein